MADKIKSIESYVAHKFNCFITQSAIDDFMLQKEKNESVNKDKIIKELKIENHRYKELYKHLTMHENPLTASQLNRAIATGKCMGVDIYIVENRELKQKLSQIAELTNQIINVTDKPACVHDKECPLNGGDGFDTHCNKTCPFIIAQQIKQIAQGE